jgi:hypothetical protein
MDIEKHLLRATEMLPASFDDPDGMIHWMVLEYILRAL